MNGAEVLHDVEGVTRVKEQERQAAGGTINPEIIAMWQLLPNYSRRYQDFLRRRIAFDIRFFQEPRIRREEMSDWLAINTAVQHVFYEMPEKIHPLPKGWKNVFHDVMRLYGNPEGE